MPSVTASTIPGRQGKNILRSKVLEKNLPQQHGKMRDSTLDERRLPKLDQVAKTLAAELGRVREKERQKIAGDLHDQIGQNLVLAKMKLDALKSSLGNKHMALVAGISDLISHTIKDTRSLIHELHPEWLISAKLKEAVRLARRADRGEIWPTLHRWIRAAIEAIKKGCSRSVISSRPGAASERGQACGCKRGENCL